MLTIGVRELRQHASRYLARVEAGEEVAVTNHGRLVARIVPIDEGRATRNSLIDAGLLIPARRDGLGQIDVASLQTAELSAAIVSDRDDG